MRHPRTLSPSLYRFTCTARCLATNRCFEFARIQAYNLANTRQSLAALPEAEILIGDHNARQDSVGHLRVRHVSRHSLQSCRSPYVSPNSSLAFMYVARNFVNGCETQFISLRSTAPSLETLLSTRGERHNPTPPHCAGNLDDSTGHHGWEPVASLDSPAYLLR